ncbi:hypothetical protein SY83_14030 [Paenibacillus swuensis]|uniref:Single-stranded-DNA-specific exonuclease RecJ n=1 Tax=Paenibacillus swuensis TaxID=1178515 RepID=A0A172TK60_9BACL|nr:single-stranded-DNA-specific exonuclease RecJ [Paenibacillus swuensis]ANE47197.1 hypothetical protein SY83_14030 [Paenibacillus swuensis]
MLQAKAKWNITEYDEALIERLSAEWGVQPFLLKLLHARGITTAEEASRFLQGDEGEIHDPFLLKGMREATARIRKALEEGEYIRVYGDYDADGVSSTSLLVHLLRGLGAKFDHYIPHRAKEGYGLNIAAIEAAKAEGVSLIVTVDTGISAVEQIAFANSVQIDVIVTDHHEPPDILPQALALINPKLTDCPYPYKSLAGVGVAFKLAHALLGRFPEELLEMAVIGTVADLMPLTGENRAIVRRGMKRIRNSDNPGIKALLDVAGVELSKVSAGNIAFAVAPRINAAGRLQHANLAVHLLTTLDTSEAELLSHELDLLNKERQAIVEDIAGQALEQVTAQGLEQDKVLVVAGESWNVGVIGIVASKLLDRHYRPAIVLGVDPETGMCKGSARSIPGFDMYKALSSVSELFAHYGGHQAAAGMTLHRDQLPQLRQRLNEMAEHWLMADDLLPKLSADMVCGLSEVTLETIQLAESLAPFGMSNPAPRFVLEGLQIREIRTMGKDKQHIKLTLTDPEGKAKPLEALAFNRPQLVHALSSTSRLDLLAELSINEWNGTRKPQIMIQDVRVNQLQIFDWRGIPTPQDKLEALADEVRACAVLASRPAAERLAADGKLGACGLWSWEPDGTALPVNDAAKARPLAFVHNVVLYSLPECLTRIHKLLINGQTMERIYAVFAADGQRNQTLTLPSREDFKGMYAILKQREQWNIRSGELHTHLRRRSGISEDAASFILQVFEELSFIEKDGHSIRCTSAPSKQDLTTAQAYQRRVKQLEAEEIFVYSSAQELTDWFLKQPGFESSEPQQPNLLEEIV